SSRSGSAEVKLTDSEGAGGRLRALREQRGWTRRELSELAGVSQEAIYTHERGRKRPRPDTLRRLAGALGVSPADLADTGAAPGPPRRGRLSAVPTQDAAT